MKNDFSLRFCDWMRGEELLGPLSDPDTPNGAEERDEPKTETPLTVRAARVERVQLRSFGAFYAICAALCCVTLLSVMLLTVAYLPDFTSWTAYDRVLAEEYLEKGVEETGAVNIVAAMILNYRAFDTLGESFVLFTALCCVTVLLRTDSEKSRERLSSYDLTGDPILRRGASFIAPMIILYGVYVMVNGHLSPGGGFSGGAIAGAGLILLSAAFGFGTTDKFITQRLFNLISGGALGFYALSKAYNFFCEANGLDAHIPKGVPGTVFSGGLILPLNLAVGLVVSMTMFGFYCLFRRGRIGK